MQSAALILNDSVSNQVLVTGAAGFIGYHVCKRLLVDGRTVVGIDNLNDYYDPSLKQARLNRLLVSPKFTFQKLDVADALQMGNLFASNQFDLVIHLAAEVGVRNSITDPHAYLETNVVGFLNVLEGARKTPPKHLVYASSSSVYGASADFPSVETEKADRPVSVYAATKRSSELLAHTYSSLYRIPMTGLRFFTVYGPWGRPDMAYFLFTKAILEGSPVNVFNNGEMLRDFTFVGDVVDGIVRVMDVPPAADSADEKNAPCRIFNIGNGSPVSLLEFIESIERALGRQAQKRFKPMQPGDVHTTFADVTSLNEAVGFKPATKLQEGMQRFVDWYREYYEIALD
ncbi:MAG: NAD-dependent epimerase/dehydratase family protein [Rhodothermales bacterium]